MKKIELEVEGIQVAVKEEDLPLFLRALRETKEAPILKRALKEEIPFQIKEELLPETAAILFGEASEQNVPSTQEIRHFILTQSPPYKHTIKSISKHFLGFEVMSTTHRSVYDNLWNKMRRAQKRIAKDKNMKWVKRKNGFGSTAVYMLVPKEH